jgi:single-strand DNA-binding protein
MKTITIAGNIGKDAETRTTTGGDKVTSWSVAVEERKGQDKRTVWFDVSLWGNRGEALAQYLTKGGKVAVAGELSTREHDGKTYLTVRADQVTLLGGQAKQERDEPKRQERQEPSRQSNMDDEIPF